MPGSPDEPDRLGTSPDLPGFAHDVVQAGNIHGGVHFHGGRYPDGQLRASCVATSAVSPTVEQKCVSSTLS
ncbi:hypothetical protein [Amycolatopsis pigmentata]|uniref:Uncharacterized protein n=1 Tax=Amycolatopsis pigmentata TaxID=450801 RepID=A0ABW5G252_9PSEU